MSAKEKKGNTPLMLTNSKDFDIINMNGWQNAVMDLQRWLAQAEVHLAVFKLLMRYHWMADAKKANASKLPDFDDAFCYVP